MVLISGRVPGESGSIGRPRVDGDKVGTMAYDRGRRKVVGDMVVAWF